VLGRPRTLGILNRTPFGLFWTPWLGQSVIRQLLLSGAVSEEPFTTPKDAPTPPTSEAVPAPMASAVVPVFALLSGTGLLKFQRATVAAEASK
jgi:hypothetical protein